MDLLLETALHSMRPEHKACPSLSPIYSYYFEHTSVSTVFPASHTNVKAICRIRMRWDLILYVRTFSQIRSKELNGVTEW